MAINIQSLFQDIIETPAQRQQRMLQEGILKGRELTAGLTGLARTQAPLVSALMMNMPQRQESLRRGIGGMLGLDVRSESEKVQDALKNVDPNNPQSLLQAAQMIQGLGLGAQAAQLRQMAADATRQKEADLLAKQQASAQIARDVEAAAASAQTREMQTLEQMRRAAQETNDYTVAQGMLRASSNILQDVSPRLARDIYSLFPSTIEGAAEARKFALELAASPERKYREVTIVNEETGNPEIVLFDDNDPEYKRVLGVDSEALDANGRTKFGRLASSPGQSLDVEAFNAQAHAQKLLSIAFNPNLEAIVGPSESRRLVPTAILAPEAAALRNEVERSITTGTLPIIRAFAPVTETDVELLQAVQLGFGDSQEVWIQKTIEEKVPESLNVLERSLIKDGQGLSAAHQMRFATSEEILKQVIESPGIFGDYSLEEAVRQAISILPNANKINVKEIPADIVVFKTPAGTIYTADIVQKLVKAQNSSLEQIVEDLDLTLIEK